MSEANKDLIKRWYEQVWNQKSEVAIDAMLHKQGKSHGFPDDDSVLEGTEAFKAIHRNFCGALPDLHIEIEDVVTEGDRVAARWRVSATHTGDHFGFAGTGRKVSMCGSSFTIIQDGQIVEGWNHMDLQAMMNKLQAQ